MCAGIGIDDGFQAKGSRRMHFIPNLMHSFANSEPERQNEWLIGLFYKLGFLNLLPLPDHLRINIPIHKIIPSPFKINAIQHSKTTNSYVLGQEGYGYGIIYENCHLFIFPIICD